MKRKEIEEEDLLENFKLMFARLILEPDRGWGVPTDEAVSDCVERVIAPALKSPKELLATFYENVNVESDKTSAVLTVTHGAELYRFSLGFSGKRKILLMRSRSRFECLIRKTLTVVERTHVCDDLNFKDILEVTTRKVIEIFDFDFWWHFSEKHRYLEEHMESGKDLNFPY